LFVDPSDNVYVSGNYRAASIIYNANESEFGTLAFPGGTVACFLIKYSSLGAVLWATRITGSTVTGRALSGDGFGNVYVAGQIDGGDATIYNSTGTVGAVIPRIAQDGYIVRYNASGIFRWFSRFSSAGRYAIVESIYVRPSGIINITGSYSTNLQPADFYNADGTVFGSLSSNSNSSGAYIVQFGLAGEASGEYILNPIDNIPANQGRTVTIINKANYGYSGTPPNDNEYIIIVKDSSNNTVETWPPTSAPRKFVFFGGVWHQAV
jgi:hypothetical protein